MNSLKDVEKCVGIELHMYNSLIYFKKDKTKNNYIIKIDNKNYTYSDFKSAINAKIIKSSYGQWLTLKDLSKISNYYEKIRKIELNGLIVGKDIFIDDFDK